MSLPTIGSAEARSFRANRARMPIALPLLCAWLPKAPCKVKPPSAPSSGELNRVLERRQPSTPARPQARPLALSHAQVRQGLRRDRTGSLRKALQRTHSPQPSAQGSRVWLRRHSHRFHRISFLASGASERRFCSQGRRSGPSWWVTTLR